LIYTLQGKAHAVWLRGTAEPGKEAAQGVHLQGKVMELREALTQISEIRQRVAQTEVFRGYRAVPVAFSGVLALGTAGVQALCLPEPASNIPGYLFLWVGAALVSLLATGLEIAMHHRHARSAMARQLTWLALRQFAPCLAAGGLVLFAVLTYASDILWMLPGLWAMLFSLGIFASWRLLPRATFWVALFYMIAGTMLLTLREEALSPWAMGVPFGFGQLFSAAVLYWTLERSDGEK
jgi:hypothetical protein